MATKKQSPIFVKECVQCRCRLKTQARSKRTCPRCGGDLRKPAEQRLPTWKRIRALIEDRLDANSEPYEGTNLNSDDLDAIEKEIRKAVNVPRLECRRLRQKLKSEIAAAKRALANSGCNNCR